jgi:hypothetical protein
MNENESNKKPNEFGKALQEWWDSDACKTEYLKLK